MYYEFNNKYNINIISQLKFDEFLHRFDDFFIKKEINNILYCYEINIVDIITPEINIINNFLAKIKYNII